MTTMKTKMTELQKLARDNKVAVSLVAMTLVVALALGILSGCDLRKMVDLDVPPAVSQSIDPAGALPPPGVEPREYSLADADRVVEDWKRFVDTATRQLEAAVGDANERHAVLASVVDLGIATVNEVAPTLPGGAFLVGGLSLLTGIFLKRPGEDKRVAKEKEDSYNAGIEKAKETIITMIETAKEKDGPKT
jgi:hypothetical protein